MLVSASTMIRDAAISVAASKVNLYKVAEKNPANTMQLLDESVTMLTDALAQVVIARGGIVRRDPSWDADHAKNLIRILGSRFTETMEEFK